MAANETRCGHCRDCAAWDRTDDGSEMPPRHGVCMRIGADIDRRDPDKSTLAWTVSMMQGDGSVFVTTEDFGCVAFMLKARND